MTFAEFFRLATRTEKEPKGRDPYPFQERLATAPELPSLVRAPTGSGKTATAILGWLWRWVSKRPGTPRRLVYCLPMRVLVEQSYEEAKKWTGALKEVLGEKVAVHRLMGGIEDQQWYLHPEKPAILIGTQDMLLSRALNRGYGASRFHWPIDFGLLNNDCLWVFDEPQLMGSGVSTSAQLAGLRAALGTFGACPSIWMSATLEPAWLDTVDFRGKVPGEPLELDAADYGPNRPLSKRMTAEKKLAPLGVSLAKDADDKEAKAVAERVLAKHEPGTQTLVVLNTVKRAKKVYETLLNLRKKPSAELPRLLLVHSRFRPKERERLNEQLRQAGDQAANRIVVATQVVEAGVDISARTLVTELAPWASVVQRIGRCNRTGDDGPGRVFWIDLDTEKQSAPYETDDLRFAREQLGKLDGKDVSPKALHDFKRDEGITLRFEHTHVLRRRDVLDLFDTSPDLSGNDIDVSRFVRGDKDDNDVQVFWRRWDGDTPPADLPAPHRSEMCSVPIGSEFREFLDKIREKKALSGYVWDHLDESWAKIDSRKVRPGLAILLPASAGGYSELGWDADSGATVEPILPPGEADREEAVGSDPNSETPASRRTLVEHTDAVCDAVAQILRGIDWLPEERSRALLTASRWHDAGKGHWVFQMAVRRVNPNLPEGEMWAKSGRKGKLDYRKINRPHFRHELASALAALQQGRPFEVAYLILAHHGRARLSIRALPKENRPEDPKRLFALGVHHNDLIPTVALGGGATCPETTLDLTPMRLGGPRSWTASALGLLAEMGPFRLAYLEALLRAADQRVSNAERKG